MPVTQGWFACPGDGAKGMGWGHWFRGGSNPRDPNSLAIDLWPDTSELDEDERCPTAFHLPSGARARRDLAFHIGGYIAPRRRQDLAGDETDPARAPGWNH